MDENNDIIAESINRKQINTIDLMQIREISRELDDNLSCVESGIQEPSVFTHYENLVKESSFHSLYDYGERVFEIINNILCVHGYDSSILVKNKKIIGLRFNTIMQGMNIIAHVFCEYRLCVYRIEMTICPVKTVDQIEDLLQLAQNTNRLLRFGHINVDILNNETKLIYSSCYHDFFSADVFDRYLGCLLLTCQNCCREIRKLSI